MKTRRGLKAAARGPYFADSSKLNGQIAISDFLAMENFLLAA